MTAPQRYTRLEHFLKAYQPVGADLEHRIWDRVHRAGWSPDDPTSLQIAHDAIMEARMAAFGKRMQAWPGQMQEATGAALHEIEQEYRHERETDRKAIAAQVAEAAGVVLRGELPKWERAFHWRTAQRQVASTALISSMALAAGYIWGRDDTTRLEQGYAQLATRSDAATWVTLQTVNGNLDELLYENCRSGQQGHIDTVSGRKACAIPLWIEGPAAPRPVNALERAATHFTSLWVHLPFGVILGLGIFIGISVSTLLRRMTQNENS